METKEEVKPFTLPNEKVIVRLVNRQRGAVSDPSHILYNLAPGATIQFCPRNKKGSNVIDCPLTEEEIEFFEDKSKSGMAFQIGELSPYRDDKVNYWRSKRANVSLSDRPLHLNLSNPADYLKYKILISNSDHVAPSAAEEFNKKTYIYVVTSDKEVQVQTLKKGDKLKRAVRIATKMEDDRERMIDYLTVIGKRPSANSKLDFLIAEIDKQVETNIDEFLSVNEDPQFETRILLTKSLQNKSVIREGSKYFLSGGDEMCKRGEVNNMKSALDFLDANENQDIRLTLEAKIK